MRTPTMKRIELRVPPQVLTPSKRNFLRVNAQMHNLDKQKTYACLENVSTNFGRLVLRQVHHRQKHFQTIRRTGDRFDATTQTHI